MTSEGLLTKESLGSFRATIAASPENSVKSLADILFSLSSKGSAATWGSALGNSRDDYNGVGDGDDDDDGVGRCRSRKVCVCV